MVKRVSCDNYNRSRQTIEAFQTFYKIFKNVGIFIVTTQDFVPIPYVHIGNLDNIGDSFGCFQPSVAQASSEGWFGRVLGAEACDFVGLQGPRNDVVFVLRHGPPFAIAARRRSTFSARARATREEYLSCQLATRQLSAPHGRRTAPQTGRI